jgi:hypothetical protein
VAIDCGMKSAQCPWVKSTNISLDPGAQKGQSQHHHEDEIQFRAGSAVKWGGLFWGVAVNGTRSLPAYLRTREGRSGSRGVGGQEGLQCQAGTL